MAFVSDFQNVISPWLEMLSWETLWGLKNQTVRTLHRLFTSAGTTLPSEALESARSHELLPLDDLAEKVKAYIASLSAHRSVAVCGTFQYPHRLREAKYPIALFYYRGDIGLTESRCVSIVGARKCSPEGARRAARLAQELVDAKYTIVSGLAAGIDTAAMRSAIESGGRTIGVIGTPINKTYPKENAALQEQVADEHLLISHVPFYRYATEHYMQHRYYFPQRNETMATLSAATIIVEASETSGSHTQARACMHQGRKLFILNSCFESGLTWPRYYEERGADSSARNARRSSRSRWRSSQWERRASFGISSTIRSIIRHV